MSASYYYYFILQYAPLIPLVAAVPNFRKLDPPLRVFLYFTLFSLAMTIVMTIVAFRRENNLWMMNLSQPVYVGMLLWVFQYWELDKRVRNLIRSLFLPFILVWLFEIILGGELFQFSMYTKPLEGVIFTFVACLTIYRLNRIFDEPITAKPAFWISAGIFLYWGAAIIIDLVSRKLLEQSAETLRHVMLFDVTLSFLAQILFLIGYRQRIRRYSSTVGEALA